MPYDLEDQQAINLVNRNNAKIKYESIRRQQEELFAQAKIKYQPRPKNKQKDFIKKAVVGIVATCTLLGVGSVVVKSTGDYLDRLQFTNEISQHVRDNKYNPGSYQADGQLAYAYRDLGEVARETLEENKDVDIDTRIYGAYYGLGDYEKDENMDTIMAELQALVTEDPMKYTEDEVRACNHSSFADYLNSLGMDKDEYIKFMRELTFAYGQNDLDRVQKLLAQLNGGGR